VTAKPSFRIAFVPRARLSIVTILEHVHASSFRAAGIFRTEIAVVARDRSVFARATHAAADMTRIAVIAHDGFVTAIAVFARVDRARIVIVADFGDVANSSGGSVARVGRARIAVIDPRKRSEYAISVHAAVGSTSIAIVAFDGVVTDYAIFAVVESARVVVIAFDWVVTDDAIFAIIAGTRIVVVAYDRFVAALSS